MEFKIGKRLIGDDNPALIVAELSCNHCQKYDLAVKTIKAMAKAGADAVKLQTYTPDSLTLDCPQSKYEYFQKAKTGLWKGWTPWELFKTAYTPWDWQPKLKRLAEKLGLICFSAPFDHRAVEFCAKLKMPAYKVGSPEITDIPLIEHMAKQDKPMIMSTGVAELADIKLAIDACKKVGNRKIVLLKCAASYPTPLNDVNLRTIPTLRKKFKTLMGLSDHTLSATVGVTAVALGACLIEKHFILSRKLPGHDKAFSLEPSEFKNMIMAIRDAEKAMGNSIYKLSPELKARKNICRSLFVAKDIKKDEILSNKNIRSIRPNNGLAPKYLNQVLGKKAKGDLEKGTPLRWNMICVK